MSRVKGLPSSLPALVLNPSASFGLSGRHQRAVRRDSGDWQRVGGVPVVLVDIQHTRSAAVFRKVFQVRRRQWYKVVG